MGPFSKRLLSVVTGALLMASVSSCGGAGVLSSPSPIRDRCPSEDVYLADFYTLIDQGKLSTISQLLRDELSYDIQSDLAIAMIRLVGWVPAGTFEGLQVIDDEVDTSESQGEELAIVMRWMAANGPSAPYSGQFTVVRSMLETCPGESTLKLLSALLKDVELMGGGGELLGSVELDVILSEFELEDEKGRSAVKALVRNMLAVVESPDFDVVALLDVLGLLLDLDEGAGIEFRELMQTFLADGEHREALVALVNCVQATDPELQLVDLVYDLLTDKSLALTQLFELGSSAEPEASGDANDEANNSALPTIIEGMARDSTVRRGVSKVMILMLQPDYAPGVLMDVANVLEAELLDNFIQLAAAYATKSCE